MQKSGNLRNEIDNGSIAYFKYFREHSRVVGRVHYDLQRRCRRTANLEDVLDIDEIHLSSKRWGREMLSLPLGAKGEFWLFLISESL